MKAAENVRTAVMLLHIYKGIYLCKVCNCASFQYPIPSVAGVCSLSQVRAFATL